ncbi:MAG: hypothetical protein GY909_00220 [Oligoflexia bacterium]|nr:hypothetical protein [Oligoflexia bacterium]
MKKLFLLFSIAGCININSGYPGSNELKKHGIELKKFKEGSSSVIEYCPDNTCIQFVSNKLEPELMDAFTFLYLYHVSGYIYLKKFKQSIDKEVLNKMTKLTIQKLGKDEKSPKEILKKLSLTLGIDVNLVRFGEGEKCVTTYNIDDLIQQRSVPKFKVKTVCNKLKGK